MSYANFPKTNSPLFNGDWSPEDESLGCCGWPFMSGENTSALSPSLDLFVGDFPQIYPLSLEDSWELPFGNLFIPPVLRHWEEAGASPIFNPQQPEAWDTDSSRLGSVEVTEVSNPSNDIDNKHSMPFYRCCRM